MTPGRRLYLCARRSVLIGGVAVSAYHYAGWHGVWSSLVICAYLEDVVETPRLWRSP